MALLAATFAGILEGGGATGTGLRSGAIPRWLVTQAHRSLDQPAADRSRRPELTWTSPANVSWWKTEHGRPREAPGEQEEGKEPSPEEARPDAHEEAADVCGTLRLPGQMVLRPEDAGLLERGGVWETQQRGSTLATWSQELVSLDVRGDEVLNLNVDSDLFARTAPTNYAALRGMGWDWRAAGLPQEAPAWSPGGRPLPSPTMFMVTDCQNSLLFVLREAGSAPWDIDIYGSQGEFLARSSRDKARDAMRFFSPARQVLAVAESPHLGANAPVNLAGRAAVRPKVDDALGGVAPWELRVEQRVDGVLVKESERWALALVVQFRAARDAMRDRGENSWAVANRLWFLMIFVVVLVALYWCSAHVLIFIFRLVYPQAKQSEAETRNPFLAAGTPWLQRAAEGWRRGR